MKEISRKPLDSVMGLWLDNDMTTTNKPCTCHIEKKLNSSRFDATTGAYGPREFMCRPCLEASVDTYRAWSAARKPAPKVSMTVATEWDMVCRMVTPKSARVAARNS